MTELEQRVARLEARMDKDDDDREVRRKELDQSLKQIIDTLTKITEEMNRYKGFVGGVSLMISMAWAGIFFLKDEIVDWLNR